MFNRNARILIIDDLRTIHQILQKLLSELGFHNVEFAASGHEGYAALDEAVRFGRPFALAITDWQMPGMTGLELIQKCKDHPRLKHTTFLFATVENKVENIRLALNVGVFDYLLKPFTRDQLREKIARVAELMREVKTFPKTSHILIADDSKTVLNGLSKSLRTLGYTYIHEFSEGMESLDYFIQTTNGKNHNIDLAIVDWQMPGLTGLELYSRCQEFASLRKIPFLLSTAEECEINLQSAVKIGICDYLVKPYDVNQLKNKIARAYKVSLGLESLPTTTRFMVVDDFESVLKINISSLKALGYNDFFCTKDGEHALTELKNGYHEGRPYDIVVTDWHMPKMSGIDLTRNCRSDIFLRNTPVLMITGDGNKASQSEAIKAGVDEFVAKPFTKEALAIALKRLHTKVS